MRLFKLAMILQLLQEVHHGAGIGCHLSLSLSLSDIHMRLHFMRTDYIKAAWPIRQWYWAALICRNIIRGLPPSSFTPWKMGPHPKLRNSQAA